MNKPDQSRNQDFFTPSKLVHASVKAFNSGKLGIVLEYFAEDAVFELSGIQPGHSGRFTGKDNLRVWLKELSSQHFQFEVEIISDQNFLVITKTLIWSDQTRQLGVAPLLATDQYLVQDGKIKYVQRNLHPESLSKFLAAQAHIHE